MIYVELFPTDDPVEPDLLIGRASERRWARSRLGAGTHVVMAGPSVPASRPLRWRPCAAPLGGVTSQTRICGITRSCLAHSRLLRSRSSPTVVLWPRHWIVHGKAGVCCATCSRVEWSLTLRDSPWRGRGAGVEHPSSGRTSHAGLGATIALAQRIAERDKKRIVLFFDGFQDIATASHRFGDPDVLSKQLRAQLQRSRAGERAVRRQHGALMRDLSARAQALSRIGNFHGLSPILPSEWEQESLPATESSTYKSLRERWPRSWRWRRSDPRTTMLIARENLTVSLTRPGTARSSMAMFEAGYELAMQADRLRHEEIVERLAPPPIPTRSHCVSHAASVVQRHARQPPSEL